MTIWSEKIDRRTAIVAVGGGVVGDFGGFLSAILLRGLDFSLVPTTLLSMVDSSIGGKTAINLKKGKNLVGSFVTPKSIWVNFKSLSTLPEEHFHSGFGEMLKHAVIQSPDLLAKTLQCLTQRDFLDELVFESIQVKKSVVERDFQGVRTKAMFESWTYGGACLRDVLSAKQSSRFVCLGRLDYRASYGKHARASRGQLVEAHRRSLERIRL